MHKKGGSMSQKKPILSRRNFLLTAGAGGAAAAATLVAKTAPSEVADAKDKRATSGYKVSAHIENYYRTTKTI
jgi:nitrous oxide reductase